jgi:hypothetical protein
MEFCHFFAKRAGQLGLPRRRRESCLYLSLWLPHLAGSFLRKRPVLAPKVRNSAVSEKTTGAPRSGAL